MQLAAIVNSVHGDTHIVEVLANVSNSLKIPFGRLAWCVNAVENRMGFLSHTFPCAPERYIECCTKDLDGVFLSVAGMDVDLKPVRAFAERCGQVNWFF